MCLIYNYNGGKFNMFKNITANLQKRQRKGRPTLCKQRLNQRLRHELYSC